MVGYGFTKHREGIKHLAIERIPVYRILISVVWVFRFICTQLCSIFRFKKIIIWNVGKELTCRKLFVHFMLHYSGKKSVLYCLSSHYVYNYHKVYYTMIKYIIHIRVCMYMYIDTHIYIYIHTYIYTVFIHL